MREFFGWTKDSDMSSIYVHLSGRDVDETLFKHYGVDLEEEIKKEESPTKPKTCPRCKFVNSPAAKFCMQCSAVLGIKTAIELESREREYTDIRTQITQETIKRVPDVLADILKDLDLEEKILNLNQGLQATLDKRSR